MYMQFEFINKRINNLPEVDACNDYMSNLCLLYTIEDRVINTGPISRSADNFSRFADNRFGGHD